VLGFHGDPERRSLTELVLPIAVLLLIVRLAVNHYALGRQRMLNEAAEAVGEAGWPFRVALAVLGLATLVTAFVTRSLVGSLQAFASRAHLSTFFVAIVIVAIVGNATEHGSAVLLARRGKIARCIVASRSQTTIPIWSCGGSSAHRCAQRAKGKRDRRNHHQQDQPASEIVADRIGNEIVGAAPVEVSHESSVVRTSRVRVGHGHPDDEDAQAADQSAPEGRERACPRITGTACSDSGDHRRAKESDE
jgi:hypothetical protein